MQGIEWGQAIIHLESARTRGLGNRIDEATDHFGNKMTYTYDENGNLETAVLQESESPFFRQLGNYKAARGFMAKPVIKEIKAPDGTVLGSFEYDKKGRVTAMTDANGNSAVILGTQYLISNSGDTILN